MSSNEIAIQVSGLGKCYQIYNRPQDRLKQSIIPRLRALAGWTPKTYFHEFWALRDVSFEVRKGETVGIIGRNGSGKSTLLQLICGTLTPTNGWVQTTGRLAALLELGSGFNPEFTGRENVYLNGSILGLSKEEINARFEDIIAFADIGEFIEQPVRMYSSGMFVRLAFAISIMSQPDILIVDEALSVGDMKFQAKCMTALKRRQESGMTILFVSHDISALKSLCSRGVYLDRGELKRQGTAAEVAEHYIQKMREEMSADQQKTTTASDDAINNEVISSEKRETSLSARSGGVMKTSEEFTKRVSQFRYGTGDARITYIELLDSNDQPITVVDFDQEVKVSIYFEVFVENEISVNFNVKDDKKNNITGSNFLLAGLSLLDVLPGSRFQIDYSIRLPLHEGVYSIQAALTGPISPYQKTANYLDYIEDAIVFSVSRWERSIFWANVYLFPTVEIKPIS